MNISEVMPNGNVRVVVPIGFRIVKQAKRIVVEENETEIQMQTPFLIAIANGILWQQWLDEGFVENVQELAKFLKKERAVVSHTLQLALLSPEIIHLAIAGQLPPGINFKTFKAGLPADWDEQKKFLGIK